MLYEVITHQAVFGLDQRRMLAPTVGGVAGLDLGDGLRKLDRLAGSTQLLVATAPALLGRGAEVDRITSYNVCYTKLLRIRPYQRTASGPIL